MPFSYDQFEDTVVAYLQSKISENTAIIGAYPEAEGTWKEIGDKPIVYVACTESEFDPSESTGIVKQKEKPMIVCNVRALKRRGANGANSIIALLKQNLQGLLITGTGCERLQLESIKLQERDSDKQEWIYNVAFSTSKNQSQVVEDMDVPLSESTLQEVIFNDLVQLTQ